MNGVIMVNVRIIPAVSTEVSSGGTAIMLRKRVAAYARVSTDNDEQLTSYDAQVEYYTNYINQKEEWEFIKVYADEGLSGTSTKKRIEFNNMIADAMSGKIDMIITKAISRFARNTLDCLTYVRQLKEKGIGVYFEKENIDTLDSKGEVLLTILSSLAQDEARNISENVSWGHRKRFADGKIMLCYKNFLGYKKGENGIPEIVPEEAKTIKLIYKLFLENMTPIGIRKYLMDKKVKSPHGGNKWYVSTIISILKNEKYMGDALLQKTFTVDFLTKKTSKNNGELPQYYIENSHPGIISKEIHQMVQQEFKRREDMKSSYSSVNCFSSKIICGECGGYYGRKIWHSNDKNRKIVFRCNDKYKIKGEISCNMPHINVVTLETAFTDMFNSIFENKESVIETLERTLNEVLNTDTTEKTLLNLNIEFENLTLEINNLIKLNATTKLDQKKYSKDYNKKADRYKGIQEEILSFQEKLDAMKNTREYTVGFIETLENTDDILTEFDPNLFHSVIENITVLGKDKLEFNFKDGLKIEWDV